MTEPIDLSALQELERAATPGPWEWGLDGGVFVAIGTPGFDPGDCTPATVLHAILDECDDATVCIEAGNADLIVALRNAAPALISELKRLRAVESAAQKLTSQMERTWFIGGRHGRSELGLAWQATVESLASPTPTTPKDEKSE